MACRALTLYQAMVCYRRSHVQLRNDIKAGRLPGYKVGRKWYVFPPEIAFKEAIDKYNRLAAESTPVLGMREVAAIMDVPYGTLKRRIHEGKFPRGQQIKPYRNSRMFWDVRGLRKALRKHEGRPGKEQYSETIVNWLRRELDRNPGLKPQPASDPMLLLKQILNLPVDERQRELGLFYAALDDAATALSRNNWLLARGDSAQALLTRMTRNTENGGLRHSVCPPTRAINRQPFRMTYQDGAHRVICSGEKVLRVLRPLAAFEGNPYQP
jgi:hypothetical protein